MSDFQDLFSRQAADYAQFRPRYPSALFAHLAALSPDRRLAWDVGTGNGQAAVGLAAHFERVIATDGSREQIAQAEAHVRVAYHVSLAHVAGPAEGLHENSADLVTVAQALHWFANEPFFANVRRVLRPGGVIAAWCYGLHRIAPEIDAVTERLYREITGPYWPADRKWVDEQYTTIPFPFEEIGVAMASARVPSHSFECREDWTLGQYVGYLRSWSAVQRFRDARGFDPLDEIAEELLAVWGDGHQRRAVCWPIHIRLGCAR